MLYCYKAIVFLGSIVLTFFVLRHSWVLLVPSKKKSRKRWDWNRQESHVLGHLATLSSTPNNQRRINFIKLYIHFNILASTSILHVRPLLTKHCKHCRSWLLSFYIRTLARKNLLKTYLLRPNHPTSPIHLHSEIQSHLVAVFPSPPFLEDLATKLHFLQVDARKLPSAIFAIKTPAKVTSHVVIYPGFSRLLPSDGTGRGIGAGFFFCLFQFGAGHDLFTCLLPPIHFVASKDHANAL